MLTAVTRPSRLVLSCLFCSLLSACAGKNFAPVTYPASTASRSSPAPSTIPAGTYVVRRGDTLSAIAYRHNQTLAQLAAWNNLAPPYPIYPGQVLRVAAPPVKPVAPPRQAPSASVPLRQVYRGVLRSNSVRESSYNPVANVCQPHPGWRWPTQGNARQHFGPNGQQALQIFGSPGQPVYASAPGSVVYSGPGLKGYYGNLIIIKHGEVYNSIYAYNYSRRVNEGDKVAAGQHIADMGTDSDRRALLHFEIRCQDKTVNPLLYMPR